MTKFARLLFVAAALAATPRPLLAADPTAVHARALPFDVHLDIAEEGVVSWANEGEAGNVTAELVRHGYGQADIDKLWSGNVLRIWQAAQEQARGAAAPRPPRQASDR